MRRRICGSRGIPKLESDNVPAGSAALPPPDPAIPRLRMERQESRAEGRTEAEQALMVRLAVRRFGAKTGQRLAALLFRIDDPDRLAEAGDCIVDCTTGAELLERVEGIGSHG